MLTEEQRKRISVATKLAMQNPQVRARITANRKSYEVKPETRAKISQAHKGRTPPIVPEESRKRGQKKVSEALKGKPWSEKRRAAYKPYHMSPEACEKVRLAVIEQHKKNPMLRWTKPKFKLTSIEVKISNALKLLRIPHSTNVQMYGIPDIKLKNKKVVIFCDGCRFHGCLICGFSPNKKTIWDEKVTEKLEADGYTVLRYWEHDINNMLECVIYDIVSTSYPELIGTKIFTGTMQYSESLNGGLSINYMNKMLNIDYEKLLG